MTHFMLESGERLPLEMSQWPDNSFVILESNEKFILLLKINANLCV